MIEKARVLYCQGCGLEQVIKGELQSCAKCDGLVFHPNPPRHGQVVRVKTPKRSVVKYGEFIGGNEVPTWTRDDLLFLKVNRIAPE